MIPPEMGTLVDEASAPESLSSTDRMKIALDAACGGDPAKLEHVFELAADRMRAMATMHLNRFPRLRRWSRSDDVMQEGVLRLMRAMKAQMPRTPLHFYRLFALQLRRLLVDFHRAAFGPEGRHRHHDSPKDENRAGIEHAGEAEPIDPLDIEDLQRAVDALPDEQREVIELHSYTGLSGAEAAALLNISAREFWRRFGDAKVALADALA
jgi:RNA polymerase sigma-70 factor (ECF subfamily)